jgi:hypothetical protein
VNLSPAELDDAISRAALAASRARLLPDRWVAVPVEHDGLLYIVVLSYSPTLPVAAIYRVRADRRLKRIVRPPRPVPNLARTMAATGRMKVVPHPSMQAGVWMTDARFRPSRP